MLYVVQFCDRYDNHLIVGAFSTKEKVIEAVSEIYFQENEEFDGQFRDYYIADWFSIEVLQIEPDISYF
jgi:hypothetical protein